MKVIPNWLLRAFVYKEKFLPGGPRYVLRPYLFFVSAAVFFLSALIATEIDPRALSTGQRELLGPVVIWSIILSFVLVMATGLDIIINARAPELRNEVWSFVLRFFFLFGISKVVLLTVYVWF